MEIKNRIAFRALLGFSMGLLLGAIITILIADYAEYSNRMMMFAELVGSGILGMISMGGTIVYDLEDWGLTQATVTHYIVTVIAFFTASELLDWFPHKVLFIVFVAFTILYFIIWLINYIVWKAQVDKINEDLRSLHLKNIKKDITE